MSFKNTMKLDGSELTLVGASEHNESKKIRTVKKKSFNMKKVKTNVIM